ncbi:MAG: YihY family inner membrane protein [Gammaproteobacteria bacterium]|nr:YihY family inner membrane protein [Gammaproteobacteria bacterium]
MIKTLLLLAIRGKKLIVFICSRFFQDSCMYRAAALTFTSLLALVPLMVVIFKILSIFPASQQLFIELQKFIFANFVASSGDIIQKYLYDFSLQATQLSWFGFGFLFVTVIMMLFTIERGLNAIWQVPTHRRGLTALLRYWAILTLAPLFVGSGLIISSYLLSLPLVSVQVAQFNLLSIIPFLCIFIGFTLLYVVVPIATCVYVMV